MLLLCGCDKAAVPFYDETNDKIQFESLYNYCFTDDAYVFCNWTNGTNGEIYFTDDYSIDKQTKDGKWVNVLKKESDSSNNYSHVVSSGNTSMSKFDFDTVVPTKGTIYRISTFCYDENDNHFQVYAEFTCDDELAEAEINEIISKSLEEADKLMEEINSSDNNQNETFTDVESSTDSQ